uniref:hypothetical protein n=1 Tax=Mucilaginibacter sp. Bleaf8 TaxID=2834430 RepID=UPI001BCD1D8C|nr:hypothetical protein [Mucilaginibacter sp. Bleaf8]
MNPENAIAALRYLLQDDIYLLNADKEQLRNPKPAAPVVPEPEPAASTAPAPQRAEPPVTATQPVSEPEVIAIKTPKREFKYLGSNKKHFLVICHYPQEQFMADAHLKALESTLSRISFTQDDIALLNIATCAGTDFKQLTSFFSPEKLLILGAQARPANFPEVALNAVQTINDCIALYTFGFDEMMGHKENTKAFWNQIKTF